MSHFSLKMIFPLLVLVLLAGGVFFAATGLITPYADAYAVTQPAAPDTLAQPTAESALPSGPSRAVQQALSPEGAAAIAAGETLFKGNCAQCHALYDVVVGPALGRVGELHSEKWLIAWIRNSSKMVASGDEYAVKVFNQYQKQQMPSFQLSDDEVRQILAYIEAEGSAQASAPQAAMVLD